MKWYELFKYISLVGEMCSIIISLAGFSLIIFVSKSHKYLYKRIDETPLLRYAKVLFIGVALTTIFSISIVILS